MVDVKQAPEEPQDQATPPDSGNGGSKKPATGWKRFRRPILVFLAIMAAFIVYAYGFQVTDVNLDELQDETRQTQLVRIIRALARPDLVTYSKTDTVISAAVLIPCPDGGSAPESGTSGAQIVATPACGDPGQEVLVEGSGFAAGSTGRLSFVPDSEFAVSLTLGRFEADEDGDFSMTAELPDRPSDQPQEIQATTQVNIGSWFNREEVWEDSNNNGVEDPGEMVMSPRLSENATLTIEKIIETIFMALLATTVGTAIAVPLSFLSARNLMKDIGIPVTSLMLGVLAVPTGFAVGVIAAGLARTVSEPLTANMATAFISVLVGLFVSWRAVLWALPPEEIDPPSTSVRALRALVLIGVGFGVLVMLYVVSSLIQSVGESLDGNLGILDFLAAFVATLGELLGVLTVVIAALGGAGLLVGFSGRLGRALRAHLPSGVLRVLNYFLAAIAGAIFTITIAVAVDWLYGLDDPVKVFAVPAAIGAVLGILVTARAEKRAQVNIGLSVYYSSRTVFNGLRSIEPLVMVIVFVVWVGIGPFAGALALALHTAAALSKLYSEQVENISEGPLEAVRATGATRVQTIVYAVAPQIVPPYISFTMYRWDINVRMSTIIGFAGGGGVGLLLNQNTQLLNYRAAAAQMLAIAIVVASMDYVSSRLRERFV